jgi:hypothetical protein
MLGSAHAWLLHGAITAAAGPSVLKQRTPACHAAAVAAAVGVVLLLLRSQTYLGPTTTQRQGSLQHS